MLSPGAFDVLCVSTGALFARLLTSSSFICSFFVSLAGHQPAANPVAFTLGQTVHMHLTHGETVSFNRRFTNVGASVSNGVFTCTVPGVYAFHVYFMSHDNTTTWLEIYQNDNYMASLYAHINQDYADAGNSIILHLAEGDRVYVKAMDSFDVTLYGQPGDTYTTMTGVLIAQDPAHGTGKDICILMILA
jgi:hypothetical protein